MGAEPGTIWEVLNRQKDIQYSSRVASHIARQRQIHHMRHIINDLAKLLPDDVRKAPAVRELAAYGCPTVMHVVRLLAPQLDNENHTKDVDFSPSSIRMRWEAGYDKTMRALDQAPWENDFDPLEGVILHEPTTDLLAGRGVRGLTMSQMSPVMDMPHMHAHGGALHVLRRTLIIGLTAFLTVVDLFATQAILPSLAQHYRVTPAAMGFAVNASTMGMAVAEHCRRLVQPAHRPAVGNSAQPLRARHSDRACSRWRRISQPSRSCVSSQGLCMASAFTLTLAYLGEECSAMDAGGAFAGYITGNVASNLIGRLVSAGVADHLGLAANFYFFSALNLAGAALVYFTIRATMPMAPMADGAFGGLDAASSQCAAARGIRHRLLHPVRVHRHVHLRELRAGSRAALAWPHGAGFCLFRILAVGRHHAVRRAAPCSASARGPRSGHRSALAGFGLPLLLVPELPAVIFGLMLDRRRHVLRSGRRDRLRRPRGDRRSRLGQRHLSRLLFLRRACRQRRPWTAVRPLSVGQPASPVSACL